MRTADVYISDRLAGLLKEDESGYSFQYINEYLSLPAFGAVSLTLPLRTAPFASMTLFPFFDGLIPEGWLLEVAEKTWKLSTRDRMGLLLACCQDCIGNVSIYEILTEDS